MVMTYTENISFSSKQAYMVNAPLDSLHRHLPLKYDYTRRSGCATYIVPMSRKLSWSQQTSTSLMVLSFDPLIRVRLQPKHCPAVAGVTDTLTKELDVFLDTNTDKDTIAQWGIYINWKHHPPIQSSPALVGTCAARTTCDSTLNRNS